MILTDGPWHRRDGFAALAATLGMAEGLTRLVGGVVRDTVLGGEAADIDLATRLLPDAVIDRLRAAGIRAVPTGLAHGTVTAVLTSGPIEITTLRRDVATDGRHAKIAFSEDWREDAARRDFTINALYADYPDGRVYDYFGGLDDLAAGTVRFIGDPYRRIAEDHLRILRFFRFHARFGSAIDAAGLAACAARARDLMTLSRERIASELLRLLVAPGAVAVVALMVAHDILRPVLPEITADGVARLDRLHAREVAQAVAPAAVRRLAALLPPEPAIAEQIGARLKLSNADRRRLAGAVVPPGTARPAELAYRVGTETAIDRYLIGSDRDIAPLIGWTPPRLPIGGGAIVALGIDKGPEVARLLRLVEERWIAEDFPDRSRVERILAEVVDQAARARHSR